MCVGDQRAGCEIFFFYLRREAKSVKREAGVFESLSSNI